LAPFLVANLKIRKGGKEKKKKRGKRKRRRNFFQSTFSRDLKQRIRLALKKKKKKEGGEKGKKGEKREGKKRSTMAFGS